MKRLIVLAILLLSASPAFAAFAYRGTFTVQAAQMPASQTDFPFLILWTDNVLKVTGSGGQVTDAQGDDIRPYSTSDCATTPITAYEKVFYDGTAGTIEMWVKATGGVGATIYLCVGDSGITTDGSSTTTWETNFKGVFHLKDGTTLSVANSSQTSISPTNNGVTAAAGKVDGAATGGAAKYIDLGTVAGLNINGDFTLSAWVKTTSTSSEILIGGYDASSPFDGYGLGIGLNSAGFMDVWVGAGTWYLAGSSINDNAWNHIVVTYEVSATQVRFYKNGSADGTPTTAAPGLNYSGARKLFDSQGTGAPWSGSADEIHIASGIRSANWITSEYNNQNSQATFWGTVTFEALTAGTGYSLPQGFVRP